uniref:Secreted phosphoprotein 24 n=1 Tax=Acanthochromis polyacanthus TaxID=80966 RepID=A0A3Q1F669_9TELE
LKEKDAELLSELHLIWTSVMEKHCNYRWRPGICTETLIFIILDSSPHILVLPRTGLTSTNDLLMTFVIKETECPKTSRSDPQTCAFRPGFFVPSFSCSSRVRVSAASAQVISLRCGRDGSSSSSESSEEVRAFPLFLQSVNTCVTVHVKGVQTDKAQSIKHQRNKCSSLKRPGL